MQWRQYCVLQKGFIVLCVNFQCWIQGMIRRWTRFSQVHAMGNSKDKFTKNDKFGQSMKIADFTDRCIICSAWQRIIFLFGNVNMCNRKVGFLISAQKSLLIIMNASFGGSDWEGLTVLWGLEEVNFSSNFMDLGIGMWQMLYKEPDDIFLCGNSEWFIEWK